MATIYGHKYSNQSHVFSSNCSHSVAIAIYVHQHAFSRYLWPLACMHLVDIYGHQRTFSRYLWPLVCIFMTTSMATSIHSENIYVHQHAFSRCVCPPGQDALNSMHLVDIYGHQHTFRRYLYPPEVWLFSLL
jgi:hypothetical protein